MTFFPSLTPASNEAGFAPLGQWSRTLDRLTEEELGAPRAIELLADVARDSV
jgi:hypothetical protein